MSNRLEGRSWQSVFRWIADNPPEPRDPRATPLRRAADRYLGLDARNRRMIPRRLETSTETDQ